MRRLVLAAVIGSLAGVAFAWLLVLFWHPSIGG